ncbi:MAG: porin [Candidatus Sedimenticola sp. (ex Thyasira tokunagai)]
MKKILAVAIAAALTAPVAFADVKISGFVEQEFSFRDRASGSDVGMEHDSDVGVVFSASEDLGNGMSAFAKIDWGSDDSSMGDNDQIVGLTGGFGTVVLGRMEDFTEGKVMAMASIFESDSQNVEGGSNQGRTDGGIAYVSPNFSGFQVGVAGYAVEAATDGENFDAVDMMVAYSNGPITVRLSRETTDNDTVSYLAGLTPAVNVGKTNTSLGLQYTAGAFDARAVMQKSDNVGGTAANDFTDWMVGGSYTFGNNKVVAGYESDETTTSNTDTNWQVEFQHMFSKRTKVYVGYTDQDAANADATYFGMKHTF